MHSKRRNDQREIEFHGADIDNTGERMMKNANTRIIRGLGVVLLFVTSSWSQRLEVVPSTEVMPVIIAQPDSPLRIPAFARSLIRCG